MNSPLQTALQKLKRSLPKLLGLGRRGNEALLETLDVFAAEIQALRQENAELSKQLPPEDSDDLDAFYLHFENRYRGSLESVQEKQLPYLDDLAFLAGREAEATILDLGCGRGEWLSLLRDNGYQRASGVDANGSMIAACREQDLDVTQDDVFGFLEQAKPQSYDLITGFHIVEHFPFAQILRLLRLCHQTLKPGGIALFETPNPRNLIVGGNTFYFDPTHVRPVPIELLTSAAEHAGFQVDRIHQRNVYPDLLTAAESLPPESKLLRNTLTCGLDYGVVLAKK